MILVLTQSLAVDPQPGDALIAESKRLNPGWFGYAGPWRGPRRQPGVEDSGRRAMSPSWPQRGRGSNVPFAA